MDQNLKSQCTGTLPLTSPWHLLCRPEPSTMKRRMGLSLKKQLTPVATCGDASGVQLCHVATKRR